jgi:oligoendopeptidase F
MLAAQDETYGGVLDADARDPYFWCSKLHFYISGLSFYNFPYAFGYLFSMGVYARAKKEGAAFLPKYEELLRLTGSDTAENVARRSIGVDLESPGFWLESIDLIEEDLRQFEELAPKVVKSR